MNRIGPGGGVITTDEQQTHVPWPCVPHPAEVSCAQAQRAVAQGKRIVTPQRSTPQYGTRPR